MAEARKSDRRYGATDEPKEKVTKKPEGREGGGAEHERPMEHGAAREKPEHGGDGDMLARHVEEHRDMMKRHEKEHRDLHGTHRDAMRKMTERHASEMKQMHAKQADEMGMPAEQVGDEGAPAGGVPMSGPDGGE